MTWEAHQRSGFFGWTQTGQTPQPRHLARVDIEQARDASRGILARWWTLLQWPDAPPFSGGVLDSWPSRTSDGLALCKSEWRVIQDAVAQEAKPHV